MRRVEVCFLSLLAAVLLQPNGALNVGAADILERKLEPRSDDAVGLLASGQSGRGAETLANRPQAAMPAAAKTFAYSGCTSSFT